MALQKDKTYVIGSSITCTTNHNDVYRGNILAFDMNYKSIMIENETGDRIHIVNLANVGQVDVDTSKSKTFPKNKIDLSKVTRRYDEAVEKRRQELLKIGEGVSVEAQQLFNRLYSVYNETRWDGPVIVVMNDVRISPPYQQENCTGASSTSIGAVERVKKIVGRFYAESS